MLRRLAAATLLALLLAACGGGEPDANVALEESPAATTAPTPAPTPEPTEAEPPAAAPTEATTEAPSTELPEVPPADPPAATEGPAPAPDTEVETFELSLNGDGTEGGCSWGVDADEFFYEIVYPDGYEVAGSPVSVVGPDGEVVASEGQGMRVTGRLAPDREPSCGTGTVLVAETVEPL